MTKGAISAAATVLRRLLDRLAAGELDAPPGFIARLEGATAALEALAQRSSRPRSS